MLKSKIERNRLFREPYNLNEPFFKETYAAKAFKPF